MKLELKAYKCVFPNLYVDAYTRHMWEDPKQYETIWGKTQKEAVKERCLNDEIYGYWELKSSIRTRRFPEKDFYKQEKSILLETFTDKQIFHLTHSLGVKPGGFYKGDFYRNYSMYYEKHEDCEKLCSLGLMECREKLGSQVYYVTEKGIEAVKTLLLIHKN